METKFNGNGKMTAEQLDKVAGGAWTQSHMDMEDAFVRKLPGFENLEPYKDSTMDYCLHNWDKVVGQLKELFAQHGIELTYKGPFLEDNIYTYQGKSITRDEAWKIIDRK